MCQITVEADIDAPRDVPHGDLLHGLLYADLLELDKLGAAGLHVEDAGIRVLAAKVARALEQRHERLPRDGLVDLALALVAGVGDDLGEGLHIGRPRHDTLEDDKLPNMCRTDKSHRSLSHFCSWIYLKFTII